MPQGDAVGVNGETGGSGAYQSCPRLRADEGPQVRVHHVGIDGAETMAEAVVDWSGRCAEGERTGGLMCRSARFDRPFHASPKSVR